MNEPKGEYKTSKANHARILTYNFMQLHYHERIRIVRDLGLVDAGKRPMSEREFFAKCFQKASRDKKLAQLWDEVKKASRPEGVNNSMGENPFKKNEVAAPASDSLFNTFEEFTENMLTVMRGLQDKASETGEVQTARFSTNGWKPLANGKGRVRIETVEMTITPIKE